MAKSDRKEGPDLKAMVVAAKDPFIKLARNRPGGVDWENEAQFAMQALKKSDYLAGSDPTSIRDAVINVASVGLSLNPALGHAALVPRYDKEKRKTLCCLDPMYRGLIHLAIQGGGVISVRADVVRERDIEEGHFHYESGTNPRIIHNPNPFQDAKTRGPIVGAYVVAEIKDSKFPHVTVLSRERLEQIRNMSEMYKKHKKGPWVDHEEEMAKKTVIKVGSKSWGTGNAKINEAIAMANVADGYDEEAIDVVPVVLVSPEQATELKDLAILRNVPLAKIFESFDIEKMEDLPLANYEGCKKRILRAGAGYALRHIVNQPIKASDYGMTTKAMAALAAEMGVKEAKIV